MVTAIGVVAVVLGAVLALSQIHRDDGRQRTPTVTFPPTEGARGETTLHSPALSHHLEADLEAIPDVHDARVGLFGRYPTIEMRAVLAVGDNIDLERLPAQVDAVLARMANHHRNPTRPGPDHHPIQSRRPPTPTRLAGNTVTPTAEPDPREAGACPTAQKELRMLVFALIFLIILIALGLIGFVVHGLFWLFIIAVVLFVVGLLTGGSRLSRRSKR